MANKKRDKDVQLEMADYLARETEEREKRGATPAEARRQAAMLLGNAERWREEAGGARRWENAWREMRLALRGLRRTPALAVAAVLMLGLGIGATSAAFALVERILLQPLPYPQAERLAKVDLAAPGMGLPDMDMGPAYFQLIEKQNRTFAAMGMYADTRITVTGHGTPEVVPGLEVTEGTLEALEARPAAGRGFTAADMVYHAPAVAMLAYGYWQQAFGGNRGAVGTQITLDGQLTTIVGVLPAGFTVLDRTTVGIYRPLRFDPAHLYLGNFSWSCLGRLRPGVGLAEAGADVARLLPAVLRSYPAPPGYSVGVFEQARLQPHLTWLKDAVIGDSGRLLWMLLASLGLVLLIVCANTANLLLVRAEGRQRELAVRAALGASGARLAGMLVSESLWLGAMGGALGMAVAAAGLDGLKAAAPAGLARLAEVRMDGWTALFTLGLGVAAGLLLALGPALRVQRQARRPGALGARGASASRRTQRTRNALVVAQVALACVLLVAVGLMLRSAVALARVSPGFDAAAPVETFRLSFTSATYADARATFQAQQRVVEAVAAVPGVEAAGMASSVPLDRGMSQDPVYVQGRDREDGKLPALRNFHYISPGYFRAMGIPLLAGRDMRWEDAAETRPVAVVSAAFARAYWKDPAEAVGHWIRISRADDWRQIVGVAGDVHETGLNRAAPTEVYWPLLAAKFESSPLNAVPVVAVVARTKGAGTAALAAELRRAVWSVDRDLAPARMGTMQAQYEHSMAQTRFTMAVLGLAAGMGLLVGLIGLYGVLAYSVAQRRREIGVRLALGAAPAGQWRAVVRQGLGLAAAGTAAGLAGAALAAGLLASLLYGVEPNDPATLAAVGAAMLAVAAAASALPARTAARVNPTEALRAE